MAGDTSIGEQQRVVIARAVLLTPSLLVIDEPTGQQGDEHVEMVLAAITAAAHAGSSVLVSTHDERVQQISHRLLRLDDGHVVS